MKSRIAKLQRAIARENIDALIVSELSHVRYLCGFAATEVLDGVLVVLRKSAHLFTDFRYREQAAEQVNGAKIHVVERQLIIDLCDFESLGKPHLRIGFERDFLTYGTLEKLKSGISKGVFIPTNDLVEDLSIIKDRIELSKIKGAVNISDTAFERILGMIEPGLRENEIAAELEYQMKMLGSEKPAFETIVASGYRAALPHGLASSKVIKKGEMITFDFGATYEGYVSDITRTVFVGKATSRQKKVYNTVAKAQLKAIDAAKANMACEKLDAVARDFIKKAGYGKYFGHGLGHGIGLLVHEGPRLSPKSDYILKPGNVVTIEPGIYIPKWGGVRIEDDVLIRRGGCTVLNRAPKELIEL